MATIHCGGIFAKIDNTVKVHAEVKGLPSIQLPSVTPEVIFPNLMKWDDIKIEGLNTKNVVGIDIICGGGDVVTATVYYWIKDPETDKFKTVSERFNLKSLSFETSMRETHFDWEPKRRKMLELDELSSENRNEIEEKRTV